MNWIKDYQLFLFDFDGLLVDTEPLHFAAYREMCAEQGFNLDWDLNQFYRASHLKASGMKEAIFAAFPALKAIDWHLLYETKKKAYLGLLKEAPITLMPGVEELLKVIINSCVVTNSPREQVEIIKERLPLLKKIPNWLTREDYSQPKPRLRGILKRLPNGVKRGIASSALKTL